MTATKDGPNMTKIDDQTKDRIKGVMFGHAIGDALGFGAEFISKREVAEKYPTGLHDYCQIKLDGMLALHQPGKWTDDTAQMLCILGCLFEKKKVHLGNIAKRFYRWMVDDGFGIGFNTSAVLGDPDYLAHPRKIAEEVWEQGGRKSAANGALMRTSVLGVWDFYKPEIVKQQAAEVCRMTHADPRCIASCVAYCSTIAALLRGEKDGQQLVADALATVLEIEPGAQAWIQRGRDFNDISKLDLACDTQNGEGIGYTYLSLAAAYWALHHAESFEHGLLAIINEGGDADTNGAIAGALLGAKFGFSNIPERLVEGLIKREALMSDFDDLIQLMEARAAKNS
jgi:ADP-ribosylglycohydrolase